MSIQLTGRIISKGYGEGEAIVTQEHISFNAGIDPDTGKVTERNHELEGECVTGKVLVFPGGKGSTGGSWTILRMSDQGTAPIAMINIETEPIVAIGAILGRIPLIDKLEQNPINIVQTGDIVQVNANEGTINIIKKE